MTTILPEHLPDTIVHYSIEVREALTPLLRSLRSTNDNSGDLAFFMQEIYKDEVIQESIEFMRSR